MGITFGVLPKGKWKLESGIERETEAGSVVTLISESIRGRALLMVVGHQQKEYGCSLERFSAEDREWLVSVMGRQIETAYRQGFAEGTAYVREPIKAALGVKP